MESLREKLKPYSKSKYANSSSMDGMMTKIDEAVVEDYDSDTSPPVVE